VSATPATVDAALAQARALGLARLDAQLLLAHHLGQPRTWLLAHGDALLPEPAATALAADMARCADGVPLAYLLGEREFHGLPLQVSPAVLVPRPDTETLVDWALALLPEGSPAAVLDLGTGSGAIALALKHRRPALQVHASDASADALAVAQANGQRLGLAVAWRHGPWWQPWAGQAFALVAANSPYIAEGDAHLPALRHEPRQALVAGADGLADLRSITATALAHLHPGGWLLLEHGWDQGDAVAALLQAAGFTAVQYRRDLAGHTRCTGGCKPPAL
jgi:release factor glutamine methyltransferase